MGKLKEKKTKEKGIKRKRKVWFLGCNINGHLVWNAVFLSASEIERPLDFVF